MAAFTGPTHVLPRRFGTGAHTVAREGRAPIVVLDRDAQTRAAIASALGDFHVHEAETLSAGGDMVNDLRPRALVCSLDFDPLEMLCFTLWLRAMFGRSLALVVLTPRGDTARAIRALQLGARASIDVPIDPARLRTLISKHAAPAAAAV